MIFVSDYRVLKLKSSSRILAKRSTGDRVSVADARNALGDRSGKNFYDSRYSLEGDKRLAREEKGEVRIAL